MMRELYTAALWVTVSFLVIAGAAQADSRIVYDTPHGELTVEYRDQNHMRFRLPEGNFLLITGGEGYALTRDDGGWMAVSAKQIRAMVQANGSGEQVRLTPLGEHETVAGIRGERYRVEVGDDWTNEWRDDGEVVLSDDARVRASGPALKRMAELFGNVDDAAAFSDASGVDISRYGLVMADDMRLSSVSAERLGDHTFQLPPNVRHQELPARAAGSAGGQQREAGDSGWLGRQMEGAQREAQSEVERETQREIRQGVRDTVRGVFGR
jgi:hypothetical protein